jgi:lipoprotein-anchoring transpeptidase ErfK/SrfK
MKKFAFALLIAAVAASPAAAAQKKAKKETAAEPVPMAQPVEAPQPTQAQITNQNSANFARDSLPVFLPSWSMPAYMAITKPAQNPPQQ